MNLMTNWYSVRCIFHWTLADTYEERITIWQADSLDHAIEKAESEARQYVASGEGFKYLGLAQAFELEEGGLSDGKEVFSLLRDSNLPPAEYLETFFTSGAERQQT